MDVPLFQHGNNAISIAAMLISLSETEITTKVKMMANAKSPVALIRWGDEAKEHLQQVIQTMGDLMGVECVFL